MSDATVEAEPKKGTRRSFFGKSLKVAAYTTAALTGMINPFESNRQRSSQTRAQTPQTEVIDRTVAEIQIKAFVFDKYKGADLSWINQQIENATNEHLDKHEFFPPYAAKIKGYHQQILNAAQTMKEITGRALEPEWIGIMFGLILSESSGDPNSVNVDPNDPKNPDKVDRGLCQIRKPTEEMVKKRLNWGDIDIFDPGINITLGLTYLMMLEEKYNDPFLALSAYNAGEGKVDEYLKGHGSPLNNPGKDYVIKVLGSTKAVLLQTKA